jgi:hypothetical protein
LAGLRNGSIFEINESTEDKKLLLASHHEGEAWGLEIVPENNSIFTVGDDNKIMEFNYETKRFVREGVLSTNKPKNEKKVKEVTASTLSQYPPNQ